MNKFVQSLFFYILSGVGISLTLKADIGVSSFNSLNAVLGEVSSLKIGTLTFCINLLFLVTSICLAKKKEPKKYLFMLLSILGLGSVINFFFYTILIHLPIEAYMFKLLLFIIGTCLAGYATGRVIQLNVLGFPIENVCQQLAQRTAIPFRHFRYGIDLFCVLVSFFVSFIGNYPLYIREGTIISLFLLSGVISLTQSMDEKKQKRIKHQQIKSE